MTDQHKAFLTELIDEKPDTVLDEMMENLTAQFINLESSKTALHNFVTQRATFI